MRITAAWEIVLTKGFPINPLSPELNPILLFTGIISSPFSPR
jgi:hypothetical protein